MSEREARRRAFERRIGRWLILVTYLSVGLLTIGVALMAIAMISPMEGGPALDPTRLLPGLIALDPSAFLWLGLLAVIGTPVTRVVAAAIGFARTSEWLLVLAALGILAIVAVSVASVLFLPGAFGGSSR